MSSPQTSVGHRDVGPKQHTHHRILHLSRGNNNRRSEPQHWNRSCDARQQVSILGPHFAYNIAGYQHDFPPPNFSSAPSKYLLSQSCENVNLVSAYNFHHSSPPRHPSQLTTTAYPYTVLPASWSNLCEVSSTTSAMECLPRHTDPEADMKAMMKHVRHFSTHNQPAGTEAGDAAANRKRVIDLLNEMAAYWINQEALRRGHQLPRAHAETSFIRPFGSYGLGICGPESDLDAVLVAPRYVRREDFFGDFLSLLRAHFEVIKDVAPVENAFVPVVKFSVDGVDVDLTFATLARAIVPHVETDLLVDDLMVGMDDKSVRSLNGWRVCKFIEKYVPNVELFRTVLMVIKDWAKARLIYSNSCGYLGGVSWAILVAYVCKTHPSPSPVVQIRNFFTCFAHWDWKKPVLLCELQLPSCQCFDPSAKDTYDPKSLYENHLMPIMTPCYPYQNSSFNVNRTTYQHIVGTIRAANCLLGGIQDGKSTWADFFEKADPVSEYGTFLVLLIKARDDGALKRWKGCVESKIRQLMQSFENIRDVTRAQIFPVSYRVSASSSSVSASQSSQCIWLVGVEHVHIDPGKHDSVKKAVQEWKATINQQGLLMLKNDQNGTYTVHCAFKSSTSVRQMLAPGQDNVITLNTQSGAFGSPHSSHA